MPRIGAGTFLLTMLYVIVGLGTLNLLSQRFAGNPLADAWAGLFNVHNH